MTFKRTAFFTVVYHCTAARGQLLIVMDFQAVRRLPFFFLFALFETQLKLMKFLLCLAIAAGAASRHWIVHEWWQSPSDVNSFGPEMVHLRRDSAQLSTFKVPWFGLLWPNGPMEKPYWTSVPTLTCTPAPHPDPVNNRFCFLKDLIQSLLYVYPHRYVESANINANMRLQQSEWAKFVLTVFIANFVSWQQTHMWRARGSANEHWLNTKKESVKDCNFGRFLSQPAAWFTCTSYVIATDSRTRVPPKSWNIVVCWWLAHKTNIHTAEWRHAAHVKALTDITGTFFCIHQLHAGSSCGLGYANARAWSAQVMDTLIAADSLLTAAEKMVHGLAQGQWWALNSLHFKTYQGLWYFVSQFLRVYVYPMIKIPEPNFNLYSNMESEPWNPLKQWRWTKMFS